MVAYATWFGVLIIDFENSSKCNLISIIVHHVVFQSLLKVFMFDFLP